MEIYMQNLKTYGENNQLKRSLQPNFCIYSSLLQNYSIIATTLAHDKTTGPDYRFQS